MELAIQLSYDPKIYYKAEENIFGNPSALLQGLKLNVEAKGSA